MSEPLSQSAEAGTPKIPASKDKNCPFCGQAFTSSSLGRHLDLYIKDRNPKAPDGIHDVEAIKKLRGNITRRLPRGSSIGGHRDGSTPVGTPTASSRKVSVAQDTDGHCSPAIPKDGQYVVDSSLSKFPFNHSWETTGVINDIPGKGKWDGNATPDTNRRPGMQRNVSRQVAQKVQLDVKQKLADAMDTARAAELALRELLSSWRAAKQQIDNSSQPFDFDPLSLDFPALTLQCLRPPPTLFSSTQHPTSTSWSVQSPAKREFEALRTYFHEAFRSWKVTCASATTVAYEELTYPPTDTPQRDVREAVKKAEKSAENLEKQVNEHLQSAYAVWDSLPVARRNELWILELARSVGRKHKEIDNMAEKQHKLKQENANLKTQVDQLNRLQQPREFKILSPVTVPFDRDLVAHAYEQGVRGGKGVGFSMEDRHVDLSSLVTKSIERWKSVITSTRVATGGMNAQRSLDQPSQRSGAATTTDMSPTQPSSQSQTPQTSQRPHPPKRQSTTSTNGPVSDHTSASTTAPPSIEETSDQDADAEMEDDDSFAIMNASPAKGATPTMPQQASLEVPRTRPPIQQLSAADPRFVMRNSHGSPVGRTSINMTRSMPNMAMAMPGNTIPGGDIAMAMQGVRGDAMYME